MPLRHQAHKQIRAAENICRSCQHRYRTYVSGAILELASGVLDPLPSKGHLKRNLPVALMTKEKIQSPSSISMHLEASHRYGSTTGWTSHTFNTHTATQSDQPWPRRLTVPCCPPAGPLRRAVQTPTLATTIKSRAESTRC